MPRINAPTVREHHDLQHQVILDAVGGILAADGYEGLELARVARQVGMARTSLYRYARDKDELVAQWLQRAFAPVMSQAQAVLGAPGPPEERLSVWLDCQLEFAARPRDGAAARLMAQFDQLPQAIQEMVLEGHRPLRDALSAVVADALREQPDRDPELVLAFIEAVAASASRRAAEGLTSELRVEVRHSVLALLRKG